MHDKKFPILKGLRSGYIRLCVEYYETCNVILKNQKKMCNRDNDNRELEFSQFKQIWNHLCTMLREEYLKTLRSIHFQFNSFLSLNERKAFLLLCEKSKCEKISICKCDIFLYLMWIECTLWRRTPARPALDTHPRQSHLTRLAKSEPPHAKLPNCWVSDTTLFSTEQSFPVK